MSAISFEFDPGEEHQSDNPICIVEWESANGQVQKAGFDLATTRQLQFLISNILYRMEWHKAKWLFVSNYSGIGKTHILSKQQYENNDLIAEGALCGAKPPSYDGSQTYWSFTKPLLHPVRLDPPNKPREKYGTGMCQRCVKAWLKQGGEV